MIDFLKELFEDNLTVDDREASFTFEIPSFDGKFSFLVPKSGPWKHLVYLQILTTVIQVLFAWIIYEGIVKRRGEISSLIIGWAFVIPASLCLPFYLLETLDLRYGKNTRICFLTTTECQKTGIVLILLSALFSHLRHKVLCLGSTAAATTIFFRCFEAMYGTSPEFVESSLSNYCGYFTHLVRTCSTFELESLVEMRLASF